jgi:hypothetical protein
MAAKKRPNKISAADRAFNKQAREYQKKYDARKAAAKKAGAKKTFTFTDDEYRKFFKQEREGGIPKATIEKLKQRTEAEKMRERAIRNQEYAKLAKKKASKKKAASKKAPAKKTTARRASSSGSTNITMDDVRAYRAKMKAKKASAKKAKSMSQKQARRK